MLDFHKVDSRQHTAWTLDEVHRRIDLKQNGFNRTRLHRKTRRDNVSGTGALPVLSAEYLAPSTPLLVDKRSLQQGRVRRQPGVGKP